MTPIDTTTAAILALVEDLRGREPNAVRCAHTAASALEALVRERDALVPAAELAAALDAAELDGVTPRDGTVLNAWAYRKLLDEDRVWLMAQPRTLERDHVALILDLEHKGLRHNNRVWAADREMVRRQARFAAEMGMGALRAEVERLKAELHIEAIEALAQRTRAEALDAARIAAEELHLADEQTVRNLEARLAEKERPLTPPLAIALVYGGTSRARVMEHVDEALRRAHELLPNDEADIDPRLHEMVDHVRGLALAVQVIDRGAREETTAVEGEKRKRDFDGVVARYAAMLDGEIAKAEDRAVDAAVYRLRGIVLECDCGKHVAFPDEAHERYRQHILARLGRAPEGGRS